MAALTDPMEIGCFRDGMTLQCCPELGEQPGALPLWNRAIGCGRPWSGCRTLAKAVAQDVGMSTRLLYCCHLRDSRYAARGAWEGELTVDTSGEVVMKRMTMLQRRRLW